MGIPSYFLHLVKNHPEIVEKFRAENFGAHNLYLDSNSIIYDVFYNNDWEKTSSSIPDTIIALTIKKIEEYISLIAPSKTVIISFDGVAPQSKLDQQRLRRNKSVYQAFKECEILGKSPPKWNTCEITPGTPFMAKLNNRIVEHFSPTAHNLAKYGINQLIASGPKEIGEGEYKIFDYIRSHPEKHAAEKTIIYGLDADLIMLSINHVNICPRIYLFRETPNFIQSVDNSLEPNASYVLNIPELVKTIIELMNDNGTIGRVDRIHDYIFICFFLGNDFLPHFPALNIRTGGIHKLIAAYKATMGQGDNILTDGKTIYWTNVRIFVNHMANSEEKFIVAEYHDRNKREMSHHASTPAEKFKSFELTPIHRREQEHYINPTSAYWQARYYCSLFNISSDTGGHQKGQIALNYLQGLEWNMKYYSGKCPDWRWRYAYHYPPLLQDLAKHIPQNGTQYFQNDIYNPVSDIVQLCYVLPRVQLNLLPPNIHAMLLEQHTEWYPDQDNMHFIWAYCRYFWESHLCLKTIDVAILETIAARSVAKSSPNSISNMRQNYHKKSK